jgi:hypothetical protein
MGALSAEEKTANCAGEEELSPDCAATAAAVAAVGSFCRFALKASSFGSGALGGSSTELNAALALTWPKSLWFDASGEATEGAAGCVSKISESAENCSDVVSGASSAGFVAAGNNKETATGGKFAAGSFAESFPFVPPVFATLPANCGIKPIELADGTAGEELSPVPPARSCARHRAAKLPDGPAAELALPPAPEASVVRFESAFVMAEVTVGIEPQHRLAG